MEESGKHRREKQQKEIEEEYWVRIGEKKQKGRKKGLEILKKL